mmetsp:Transcript_17718/g.54978  ORF Transcript_17718/g.54978 Transcript_17718/m.54978 type:complete len:233 (+) Transcript_17718:305-1003(+)
MAALLAAAHLLEAPVVDHADAHRKAGDAHAVARHAELAREGLEQRGAVVALEGRKQCNEGLVVRVAQQHHGVHLLGVLRDGGVANGGEHELRDGVRVIRQVVDRRAHGRAGIAMLQLGHRHGGRVALAHGGEVGGVDLLAAVDEPGDGEAEQRLRTVDALEFGGAHLEQRVRETQLLNLFLDLARHDDLAAPRDGLDARGVVDVVAVVVETLAHLVEGRVDVGALVHPRAHT